MAIIKVGLALWVYLYFASRTPTISDEQHNRLMERSERLAELLVPLVRNVYLLFAALAITAAVFAKATVGTSTANAWWMISGYLMYLTLMYTGQYNRLKLLKHIRIGRYWSFLAGLVINPVTIILYLIHAY